MKRTLIAVLLMTAVVGLAWVSGCQPGDPEVENRQVQTKCPTCGADVEQKLDRAYCARCDIYLDETTIRQAN